MKLTIAAAALLHPVGHAKGEVGEKVDNRRETSAQSTESIDPAINQVSAETMEAAEVITPKVLIDIGIFNIYKKSVTKIQVGSSDGAPHTDAEPPRYEESSIADRLDLVYGNVEGALAAGGKGGKASMPDSTGGKATKSSKVTEEPPQTASSTTSTSTVRHSNVFYAKNAFHSLKLEDSLLTNSSHS